MTARKVKVLNKAVGEALQVTVEMGAKVEGVRREFFALLKSKGLKVTVFVSPKKAHSTSTEEWHTAVKDNIAKTLYRQERWAHFEEVMSLTRKEVTVTKDDSKAEAAHKKNLAAMRTRFNQKVGEVVTQLHIGYAAYLNVDKSTGLDKAKAKKLKETEQRKANEAARKEVSEALGKDLVTTDDATVNKAIKEIGAKIVQLQKHEASSNYQGDITNAISHMKKAITALLGN